MSKTATLAATVSDNGVLVTGGSQLVTETGTQTLTNKTLTSPTLNSPTMTTPALGTPASGTLTNCTGLPLTTGVTDTLPVANGGTGAATLASGGYLKGSGTSAVTSQSGIPAGDITSGTMATARLGSGTANSGTYLRGDQAWATISTTDVLNAMASASVGAIGTYAFLNPLSASTVAPGGTLAGSSLQYGPNSTGSSSPSGTWRHMGNLSSSTQASVWLRIS